LIRKGFVMSVLPSQAAEYRRRHNPIWPELKAMLKEHGLNCYDFASSPWAASGSAKRCAMGRRQNRTPLVAPFSFRAIRAIRG